MDLPVYKIIIPEDDETGIQYVSFVENPAIKEHFMAFADKKFSFEITNEEKRIVSGPAIVADMPIARNMPPMGQFYVVFDRESIWSLGKKLARNKRYSSINTDHDTTVEGVHMIEMFFIDRERGINPPKGYEDLTDGSMWASYLVDNDEVWEKVKRGEWKGFSIEGNFGMEEMNMTETLTDVELLLDFLEKVVMRNEPIHL